MKISNEYSKRIRKLQMQMEILNVGFTAISPSANMDYLTGFVPHLDERFCCLLLTPPSFRFVVPELNADQVEAHTGLMAIRWSDTEGPLAALKTALDELKISPGQVLAADDTMRADFLLLLQEYASPGKSIPAGGLMSNLRMIKTTTEIELMSASALLSDHAMQVGIESCKPGISERQVAHKITQYFNQHKAEKVDFTIVASGPNSAFPHHTISNRILEDGDTVIIDIGATLSGYKSDITRVVHLGEPLQDVQDAYTAVLNANQAGRSVVLPGIAASRVDHAARRSLENNGFGDYFIHRTGHGLGLEVHEPPWITSTSDTVLQPGMVFSVEPGVYIPGKFGIRLEDIVVVEENGCQLLTGFPHQLVINK